MSGRDMLTRFWHNGSTSSWDRITPVGKSPLSSLLDAVSRIQEPVPSEEAPVYAANRLQHHSLSLQGPKTATAWCQIVIKKTGANFRFSEKPAPCLRPSGVSLLSPRQPPCPQSSFAGGVPVPGAAPGAQSDPPNGSSALFWVGEGCLLTSNPRAPGRRALHTSVAR